MSVSEYVDCSSNNGTPNVAQYAAAGYRRLSVKASEGTGYHWYGGENVIDQAHAHGLVVEHYHWLRPDSDAKAQADYFLRWAEKRFRAGDDVMTDFETTYKAPDPADARRADQLADFNERVRAQLATPRVYTGNWYLAGKPHCQAECRRWPVVMSDYSGVDVLPNPYGLNYVAWQFTSSAHVAGFAGRVDLNRVLKPSGGSAPDASSHHPISTRNPLEAGSMFEILYDVDTKVWYAWAPGYWHRITSATELTWAANSALCVNGKYVRAELKKAAKRRTYPHIGLNNAHTITRKQLALGGGK